MRRLFASLSRPIGAYGPVPRKAAALALFTVLLPGAACTRTPPEQALRETIAGMQAAIEARDAGALLEPVADDFGGDQGLDRQALSKLVRVQFLRHRDIGATLGPLGVDLQSDRARVSFTVVLTGDSGGLLPESGQIYEVSTGWRRDDGEWRLIQADWSPRL